MCGAFAHGAIFVNRDYEDHTMTAGSSSTGSEAGEHASEQLLDKWPAPTAQDL